MSTASTPSSSTAPSGVTPDNQGQHPQPSGNAARPMRRRIKNKTMARCTHASAAPSVTGSTVAQQRHQQQQVLPNAPAAGQTTRLAPPRIAVGTDGNRLVESPSIAITSRGHHAGSDGLSGGGSAASSGSADVPSERSSQRERRGAIAGIPRWRLANARLDLVNDDVSGGGSAASSGSADVPSEQSSQRERRGAIAGIPRWRLANARLDLDPSASANSLRVMGSGRLSCGATGASFAYTIIRL